MALSAADLARIRAHVGEQEPPTDAALGALWDSLGTVEKVAYQVLAVRLAALIAQPAKVTLEGDLTVDWSKTMDFLSGKVADLLVVIGDADEGEDEATAPLVWAGGVHRSEAEDRDQDLVDPYFTEEMFSTAGPADPRLS